MNMKKKITLKYYGHRYPEQLLMRAANMISAVTPTDRLTIRTNTKSATIYADPIQARAIAKQVKKSTGVTVIVNLPDNVGRFIDFLVAEGVFETYMKFSIYRDWAQFTTENNPMDWVSCAFIFPVHEGVKQLQIETKWQELLHPSAAPEVWFDECTEITEQQFSALSSSEKGLNILTTNLK